MKEVGAFEAKNRVWAVARLVEPGEEITITRHGQEVARLVRARDGLSREAAREAAD